MARTYVWSKCPYCNKTLSVTSHWGTGSESKIGPTEYTICPNCKNKVSNGKKEWKEMTSSEHTSEVFRFIRTDIVGIIIFSPTIGFLLYKLFVPDTFSIWITFSIVIAVLLSLFFIFSNIKVINESNKRYESYQEKMNSPEGNFYSALEDFFDIKLIVERINQLKEIASQVFSFISKYSKIVKDKEEVILGDFKEKQDLDSLCIYFDKFLALLSFYYFKGLIYYYFKDITKRPISDEIKNINKSFIDFLHKYIPEDKTEIEIQNNFQYIGEIISKKNDYIKNLQTRIVSMNNNIDYNQLLEYLKFINLSIDIENEISEYKLFANKLNA